MQFRIIEILIVVAMVALAIAGLQQATPQFETIFFTTTLALILLGFLLAGARKRRRAFWLSFALVASGYLGLAHIPDREGHSPRQTGPEVTTQLLLLSYNWSRDVWGQETIFTPGPGGVFCVQDETELGESDPFAEFPDGDSDYSSNLSLVLGSGQQVVSFGDLESFMRIGHCLWALLIGYASGHFVEWLRKSDSSGD